MANMRGSLIRDLCDRLQSCLLLGGHVEFTPGEGYLGSLEQNVIRAYTPFDVLSFFGALPSLFVLFLAPYTRMKVLRGAPSLGQANEGKSVAA